MKKLLALLLAASLLFSVTGIAFAAGSPDPAAGGAEIPVIIARGMDFNRLYTNYGTPEETPLFRGVSFGGS